MAENRIVTTLYLRLTNAARVNSELDSVSARVENLIKTLKKASGSFSPKDLRAEAEEFQKVYEQLTRASEMAAGYSGQELENRVALNSIGKEELNTALETLKAREEYSALEKDIAIKQQERIAKLNKAVLNNSAVLQGIAGMKNYGDQVEALLPIFLDLQKETGATFREIGNSIGRAFGVSEAVINETTALANRKLLGLKGVLLRLFGEGGLVTKFIETAFGTLTAIFIFQFLQTATMAFSQIYNNAKAMLINIRKLATAEEALSVGGVDITPKDFEEMIERLDKKFVLTPKVRVTGVLQKLALDLAEVGLAKEELELAANLVLLLKIKNPDKTEEEIADAFANALAGGTTQTLRNYGLPAVTEERVKDEAVRMGLARKGEDLDAEIKARAILSLANQTLIAQEDDLLKLQTESFYAWERLGEEWTNFTQELGIELQPVMDYAFSNITNLLANVRENMEFIGKIIEGLFGGMQAMVAGIIALSYTRDPIKALEIAKSTAIETRKWYEEERKNRQITMEDTPTGIRRDSGSDEDDEEADKRQKKLRDNLNDLFQDLEEFAERANEMQQNYNLEASRDLVDHNLSKERAWEDYYRDVSRIQDDLNEELADKNEKFRQREENEEAKFLERLRQLREGFLLNLEDALRERDARQVIRLTREYQMEKQNLINEFQLSQNERAQQHAEDLANRRAETEDRLAIMAEEQAVKMARMQEDFETEQKRKEEDHNIEMERLKEDVNDRLEQESIALAEEYDLNVKGQQRLYELLESYYGPGQEFDQLFAYSYSSLVANAQNALAVIEQLRAAYGGASIPGTLTSVSYQKPNTSPIQNMRTARGGKPAYGGKHAYGGAVLANGPTTALFGEGSGPELATFMPLNRIPQLFGDKLTGGREVLDLNINLADGLKEEIVSKSTERVQNAIVRVTRAK